MKKAELKAQLHQIQNDTIDKIYAEYFWRIDMLDPSKEGAAHPHCDNRILHEPGKCWACDLYPERQGLRKSLFMRFTGQDPEHGIFIWPCPAEVARSQESLNHWYGNVARTEEEAATDQIAHQEELDRVLGMHPDILAKFVHQYNAPIQDKVYCGNPVRTARQ